MNKIQEVLNKVKLRSFEKKVLVSVICYVLFIFFIRAVMLDVDPALGALFVFLFVVWTAANFIGIAMVVYVIAARAYKNRSSTSPFSKVIAWFSTDDR